MASPFTDRQPWESEMAAPAQPLQSVTVMPEQALALNPSTIRAPTSTKPPRDDRSRPAAAASRPAARTPHHATDRAVSVKAAAWPVRQRAPLLSPRFWRRSGKIVG